MIQLGQLSYYTYFDSVAPGQESQVSCQGAVANNPVVFVFPERLPEQDVVSERGVLEPGLLRHIGQRSVQVDVAPEFDHVTKHRRQQTRFAGANFANDCHQFATPNLNVNSRQKLLRFQFAPAQVNSSVDNGVFFVWIVTYLCFVDLFSKQEALDSSQGNRTLKKDNKMNTKSYSNLKSTG
jgi:hypothetical protein